MPANWTDTARRKAKADDVDATGPAAAEPAASNETTDAGTPSDAPPADDARGTRSRPRSGSASEPAAASGHPPPAAPRPTEPGLPAPPSGPATIIVALGDRTIRSRAAIVVVEAHVVRVAFDSGDIITLSPRSALGVIDPPTPRAPRTRRTA